MGENGGEVLFLGEGFSRHLGNGIIMERNLFSESIIMVLERLNFRQNYLGVTKHKI